MKNLEEQREEQKFLLRQEILRRQERERIRFFTPNGSQEKAILSLGEEGTRLIVWPAGNGVGKTCGAICALGAIIWPHLTEQSCFQSKIYKEWRLTGYPKRVRIISTSKEVEEIGSIQQEIRKWWPWGRYTLAKAGKTYESLIKTDTDWIIDIMTYNQDLAEFEGATIGFFIFNEPPPEAIYNACMARMRYGGKIIIPMTPLYESAWIKDKLIDKADKRTKVVYGDIEDNCLTHGVHGILPHEKILEMLSTYDPDELDARAHGRFMHLMGVIWSMFNRNVHVQTVKLQPNVEYFQVVDPAIGKPFAILYAYYAGDTFYIFDEWPNFDFTTARESKFTVSDYCNLFKSIEKVPVKTRILDRHFGNNRDLQTGRTLSEDFYDKGFDFLDSYSCDAEVETGILSVKEMLRYDATRSIGPLNRPRIVIDPKCKNLIRSIERWSRGPKTGKPNDDVWKDFCDCLRYLCAHAHAPQIKDFKLTGRYASYHIGGIKKKTDNWDTSRPYE